MVIWASPGGCNGLKEGEFLHPHDITIDSRDNIYVGDFWTSSIQKFDSDGNFITRWGSNGTGDGEFKSHISLGVGIEGIDVDESSGETFVYVADTGNDWIQKFDSDGNFIAKWGTRGDDQGNFNYPSGLALDSFGNIFVSDEENKNIQKFDNNGTFLLDVTGVPKFRHIHYIDVDSIGNLYVADPEFGFLDKFDNDGNFLKRWDSLFPLVNSHPSLQRTTLDSSKIKTISLIWL